MGATYTVASGGTFQPPADDMGPPCTTARRGVEIGAHTRTHPGLTALSDQAAGGRNRRPAERHRERAWDASNGLCVSVRGSWIDQRVSAVRRAIDVGVHDGAARAAHRGEDPVRAPAARRVLLPISGPLERWGSAAFQRRFCGFARAGASSAPLRWSRQLRAASHESSMPVCSVIVPAYDAAGLLPRTLRRVCESDLPRDHWELIVVDDGSTGRHGRRRGALCGHRREAPRQATVLPTRAIAASKWRAGTSSSSSTPTSWCTRTRCARFLGVIAQRARRSEPCLVPTTTSPRATGIISQYRNLIHHYVAHA